MHLSSQNVLLMLICFCAKFIALSNSKMFVIHHEKVPISAADLLLIIETTSKTVNASTLAHMKEKTLGLLDQLDIADDKVRVALIQNGENKYQDPNVKSPRSFNDIKSVVKCKLNECNNPTVLRNKINEMELMKFTPCSLPILAAEQIIFKRQNGDRPDVNNVVIFIQSFCCDDTNQFEYDHNATKRMMKTSTVFVSLFVESACNGSFHVAQTYARNKKEYAFRLSNYDYSNKKILNVIQKVLSCSQKAEVGKCKWNSNEKTCKRTLAIDPIENEKCAKSIDKPFSVETYFGSTSDICAEVIGVECKQDTDKNYKLLPQLKQRVPNLSIEQNIPRFTPEYDLRSCLDKKTNNFPKCKSPSIPIPTQKDQTSTKTTSLPTSTPEQRSLTAAEVTLKTTTTSTSSASTQKTISPEISSVTTQIKQNATIPVASGLTIVSQNNVSVSTASTRQQSTTSIIGTQQFDLSVVSPTSTGKTSITSIAAKLPVDQGDISSTSTVQASTTSISSKLPADQNTTSSTSTLQTSTTSFAPKLPVDLRETASTSTRQTSSTSFASKHPVDLGDISSTSTVKTSATSISSKLSVDQSTTSSISTVQTSTTSFAPKLPVDLGDASSTPTVQTSTTSISSKLSVDQSTTSATSTEQTSTSSIASKLPVDLGDVSLTPTVQTSTTSILSKIPVDLSSTLSTSTDQQSTTFTTLANPVILNSTISTLQTSTFSNSTKPAASVDPMIISSTFSTSKNPETPATEIELKLTVSELEGASSSTEALDREEGNSCEQICNGTANSNQCAEDVEAWIAHSNVSVYPCLKSAEKVQVACREAEGKDGCDRLAKALGAKKRSEEEDNSSFPLYAIIIIIIVILVLVSILILVLILKRQKKKAKPAPGVPATNGLSTKKSITKEVAVVADLSDGISKRSRGPKSPPIKSPKIKTSTGQSSTGGKSANAKSGATSSKKMSN